MLITLKILAAITTLRTLLIMIILIILITLETLVTLATLKILRTPLITLIFLCFVCCAALRAPATGSAWNTASYKLKPHSCVVYDKRISFWSFLGLFEGFSRRFVALCKNLPAPH